MKKLTLRALCVLIISLILVSAVPATVYSASSSDITVEGYASVSGRVYTIAEDRTLTLTPQGTLGQFNKYTLVYSSSQPLAGNIVYSDGSKQGDEDFFLEKGENITFSSLIDGYLDGKIQKSIIKITLKTIQNTKADFSVSSLSVATAEKFTGRTAYIETNRYKVGINLAWGGGISYIEDKTDGNTSISNLLNNHDTGRLVQQSYYGTKDAPYVTGKYNGEVWPYNPVQGGDLNGKASKLVDFKVEDNRIYIKSRPLDWAKNGSLTPSYMENVYTVEGNLINVANSFVDFSNYDNPKTTQELPAFYTISYLSTFCVYEGSKPWTDDALTKKTDLGFWGEETRGRTEYLASNTETWTAWVDNKDWGIGLYVPNVTMLTAGRYQYDGSKSASSDSTNYAAPVRPMTLNFGEEIAYSYLITVGSLDTIRKTFKENKDFTDNAGLRQTVSADIDFSRISFDNEDTVALFVHKNECTAELASPCVKLTAAELALNDPYATFDYTGAPEPIDVTDKQYVVITYMVPKENSVGSYTTELFFGAGDQMNPEGGKSKTFRSASDGEFHSEIINLSGKSYWTGNVNFVRVDFFSAAAEGDCMYIYSISLASSNEDAKAIAEKETSEATEKYFGSVTTQAPDTTTPTTEQATTQAPETNAPETSGETASPATTENDETTAPSDDKTDNTVLYIIIGIAAAVIIAIIVIVLIFKKRNNNF